MDKLSISDNCAVLIQFKSLLAKCKHLDSYLEKMHKDLEDPGFDPTYRLFLQAVLSKAEIHERRKRQTENEMEKVLTKTKGDDGVGTDHNGHPDLNGKLKRYQYKRGKHYTFLH